MTICVGSMYHVHLSFLLLCSCVTSFDLLSWYPHDTLVGSSGLEPPTSRLSGARSNHLSYEPMQFRPGASLALLPPYLCGHPLVEMKGFEPLTLCL